MLDFDWARRAFEVVLASGGVDSLLFWSDTASPVSIPTNAEAEDRNYEFIIPMRTDPGYLVIAQPLGHTLTEVLIDRGGINNYGAYVRLSGEVDFGGETYILYVTERLQDGSILSGLRLRTSGVAGLPVEFENVPASAALQQARETKRMWVRVVVREGASQNLEVGGGLVGMTGVMLASIFSPLHTGTAAARNRAGAIHHQLRSARNDANFDSIHLRAPNVEPVGETDDWFQLNLNVPFDLMQHV